MTRFDFDQSVIVADWQPNDWQFRLFIDYGNMTSFQLRNNRADYVKDLFVVKAKGLEIKRGRWQSVVVTWDREIQEAVIYLNGIESGTIIVPGWDLDSRMTSNGRYQLGWKADDHTYGGGDTAFSVYRGYMSNLAVHLYPFQQNDVRQFHNRGRFLDL